jgi:hypothetical protein
MHNHRRHRRYCLSLMLTLLATTLTTSEAYAAKSSSSKPKPKPKPQTEVTGLGKLEKLEKTASIFKVLYDVGSKTVESADDYAIYTASAQLEMYREIWYSWDHGTQESIERFHWVDENDGTSKYSQVFYKNNKPTGRTGTEAFPHGWGNCTNNCGIILGKDGEIIGGERTKIYPTTFRLKTTLERTPQSSAHLCDPVPVWYVFQFYNPSPTNACGVLFDSTLPTKSLGFEGRAFRNHASNQVLSYPISNSFSQSGGPLVFITIPEK